MSNDDRPEVHDEDVVLLRGPTEDGEGVTVLRARNGNMEAGELRAVKEGTPVQGAELVRLLPRTDSPLLWNVKVEYDARESLPRQAGQDRQAKPAGHAGPARVATRAYREGWDAIFTRESKDPALN